GDNIREFLRVFIFHNCSFVRCVSPVCIGQICAAASQLDFSTMDSSNSLLAEIREVNLSYLLLVQRMLNDDLPAALYRLGLSQEVADVLRRLSLSQLMRLASSNALLCRFRF